MRKNRQRGICTVGHDYRRNPMVLLGWGLAADFDVYRGSRPGQALRVLLPLAAVALLALLAVLMR